VSVNIDELSKIAVHSKTTRREVGKLGLAGFVAGALGLTAVQKTLMSVRADHPGGQPKLLLCDDVAQMCAGAGNPSRDTGTNIVRGRNYVHNANAMSNRLFKSFLQQYKGSTGQWVDVVSASYALTGSINGGYNDAVEGGNNDYSGTFYTAGGKTCASVGGTRDFRTRWEIHTSAGMTSSAIGHSTASYGVDCV